MSAASDNRGAWRRSGPPQQSQRQQMQRDRSNTPNNKENMGPNKGSTGGNAWQKPSGGAGASSSNTPQQSPRVGAQAGPEVEKHVPVNAFNRDELVDFFRQESKNTVKGLENDPNLHYKPAQEATAPKPAWGPRPHMTANGRNFFLDLEVQVKTLEVERETARRYFMILGVSPEQVMNMPSSKLDMGVKCIRSVNNKFARIHGGFNASTEEKRADLTNLTLIEFQQFFDNHPEFGPAPWRADLPPAYTTDLGTPMMVGTWIGRWESMDMDKQYGGFDELLALESPDWRKMKKDIQKRLDKILKQEQQELEGGDTAGPERSGPEPEAE